MEEINNFEVKQNTSESDRLLAVMGDFTEEYNTPPLDSYISYFDVSTVGKLNANATDDDKNQPCIVVKLREALPPGKDIPNLYRGIQVFVI